MTQDITIIDDQQSTLGGFMAQSSVTSQAIQMAAAVIDKRIATARSFPRRISKFKSEAIAALQEDKETAASAEYAKPVGGGTVKGPSVRLAELAAMFWGNLEIDVNEPIVSEKSVTVIAKAWDLERNYSAPGMATTSILDKYGNRYKQHMIETAALATASKARRNAILAIIPKSYITDLLNEAKKVAAKDGKTLEQRRSELLDFFARTYRVQQEQLFAHLEVGGIDDITPEHLDEMRAIVTAIKEGEPVESFFQTKAQSAADKVKEKIAARKSATTAKPEPTKGEPANGSATVAQPATVAEATKVELEPKPNALKDLARRAREELADVEHAVDFAHIVKALDADLSTHDPKHAAGDLAAIARRAADAKDRTDLAAFSDKQFAKAITAMLSHFDTVGSNLFGSGDDGAAKSADTMKH